MNKQFKVNKHLGREETENVGFLDIFSISYTNAFHSETKGIYCIHQVVQKS